MRTEFRLAVAAAAALAATALFAGPAVAAPAHATEPPAAHPSASAVFVQTDGLAGNAVVAYDRAPDGSLHQAGVYPTGGLGGALTGSVVDHLASQGSLVADRGLLYAVNAGSNTVTVFAVRGDRLIRLEVLAFRRLLPRERHDPRRPRLRARMLVRAERCRATSGSGTSSSASRRGTGRSDSTRRSCPSSPTRQGRWRSRRTAPSSS